MKPTFVIDPANLTPMEHRLVTLTVRLVHEALRQVLIDARTRERQLVEEIESLRRQVDGAPSQPTGKPDFEPRDLAEAADVAVALTEALVGLIETALPGTNPRFEEIP